MFKFKSLNRNGAKSFFRKKIIRGQQSSWPTLRLNNKMLRNTSKADGFDSGIDHRGPTNTVQSVFFWVILGRNYEEHCSLKISYGTIAVNMRYSTIIMVDFQN